MREKSMSILSVNSASSAVCDGWSRQMGSFDVRTEQTSAYGAEVGKFSRGDLVNNNSAEEESYLANQVMDLKGIVSLFSTFLSQIAALLSGGKDEKAISVEVVPDPVTPMVNPTSTVPKPTPTPLPELSPKCNGAKADDIWSGFRQGPDGNCVTVSAIKAAMHKFGQSPTDIYKHVGKTEQGYAVTMRDDFRLTLTHEELRQAAAGAKFYGRDRGMLKDAQFLFAVSAKRAQMENNDGRAARSFSAAIRSLNDGEDETGAGEGFLRLGLRKYMKSVPVSTLARGQVGMVNRARHSVAVIEGKEELWGKKGAAPTRGNAVALIG